MFSDLAISKSSRTILAPSPTYFCTNSDPITLQDGRMPFYRFKKKASNHLMKQASVLLATALAHRVLPVPGGPYNKTPFGGSIPRFTKRSGWRRGVSTTLNGIDISLPLFSFLNYSSVSNLSQLFNLFLATTNVAVCHVWLLFNLVDFFLLKKNTIPIHVKASDLHHCDCRVDLWWEGNVDLVPRNRKSILLSTIMATMKSIYLFLSTPTLMPSSMSVGATLSARSTTNLANCFTLMMYLNIVSITVLIWN